MAYYKREVLVTNLTADGDYPASPVSVSGDKSIAIYGTFDGATVEIIMHTEDKEGTLQELPVSTDLTYTAAEAPQYYKFPDGMPIKVRVSSAGASTDISINLHDFKELG